VYLNLFGLILNLLQIFYDNILEEMKKTKRKKNHKEHLSTAGQVFLTTAAQAQLTKILCFKVCGVGYNHKDHCSLVGRRGWSHREVLGSIPSPYGHIYFATPPARSAAGPAHQVGRRTRLSGWPQDPPIRSADGPARQVCQWDTPVRPQDPPVRSAAGPAHQVGRGTRPSGLGHACQVGPGCQAHGTSLLASGTHLPGRSLVGPACGTHYQGWLVGPGCQVGWWNRAVRLKFTNLNGHIDMTRRRIAEVSV
jgi:hypothetical protein